MANIINADNGVISGTSGVKLTADTSGVLDIQTNGTTALSISTGQAVTFSAGTANRVVYLNSSKVATTGSGLTFDGTTFTATKINSTRIDPRVFSTTSASSVTPDVSAYDQYCYTALAATLAIGAPVGTPVDGDKLLFRILDNGTNRTLTWDSTYTAIGVTIPTATTANKMLYVGCIYNAANTRWDVIAVSTQA